MGDYAQARLAECGGEPSLQNWTFNQPGFPPFFLYNVASAQCLNVEGCDTVVIYDGCTTKGGTCSGPGTFKNEQWQLSAEGALVSLLAPAGTRCATVAAADKTLSLAPCASPPGAAQTFSYDAGSGQLQGGGGLCLTAAAPPPPPSSNITTLLVGRRLPSAGAGAYALLALNNLGANATVTCGGACFAAMGFAPTDLVDVRDLYQHALVNTTAATALDIAVGAGGASTFLRISRHAA